MGELIKQTACPNCTSSDGFSIYKDENKNTYNGYCFVCLESEQKVDMDGNVLDPKEKAEVVNMFPDNKLTVDDVRDFPVRGVKERNLRKTTCDFYGMKIGYEEDGKTIGYHYYPFTKDGALVGWQERDVKRKNFHSIGHGKSDIEFVGQSKFPKGKRSVTITEGALDAMAFHQILCDKYGDQKAAGMPVVSLPNGTGSAVKIVQANYDYLTSFEKVVLMFDQDKPGREAAEHVARILPAKKTYIASFALKDACDMLINDRANELVDAYFNAESYTPAGIVTSSSTYELLAKRKDKVSYPYPECMSGVNDKTYGHRLGEIVLFTAGTGAGKTQFIREDIYHLLMTTDFKIGICSLEECVEDTALGIMSLDANKRLHLPDVECSKQEYDRAWNNTMADDRIMFLDHQGSVADESLVDKIEYMAATDHKFIFLDHITIAVSDAGNYVNSAIDQTMSALLKLVKRHNIWLGIVSHLRKQSADSKSFEAGAIPTEDDLKGSGSLKQIPWDTIAFSRNKYAKTEQARNTVKLHVLKCRTTGRTGYANKASFIEETGRLEYIEENIEELDEISQDDDEFKLQEDNII